MKFNFKQPSDFLETCVTVQNEWPWMKGQLDLWCCLIRFNISCKHYDYHLNSYRNMKILRFFQYNYIRNQTGIAVKKRSRSTQIHHLFIICANLVRPTSPILHPKAIGHLVLEKEIFKGFYMGMVANLVM